LTSMSRSAPDAAKRNRPEPSGSSDGSEDDPSYVDEAAGDVDSVAEESDPRSPASSVASHIDVQFSVDTLVKADLSSVSQALESYVPDDTRLFDYAAFAAYVHRHGVGTSIVTAENAAVDDGGSDLYGVLSAVPVAEFEAIRGVIARMQGIPQLSAAASTPPAAALRAGNSVLLVAQLFQQLPPLLVAQLYECFASEVSGAGAPRLVVVLAQVVPSGDVPLRTAPPHRRQLKKRRTDAAPRDGSLPFDHATFLRWEDELFYRARHPGVAVGWTRYAPSHPDQPDAEVRRCLAFGVSWSAFLAVVGDIRGCAERSAAGEDAGDNADA